MIGWVTSQLQALKSYIVNGWTQKVETLYRGGEGKTRVTTACPEDR